MQSSHPEFKRDLRTLRLDADLVVVGGGVAGTCCAITAARAGLKVILVQDRPVLGGNASSEVRLWILGATSHMGNNNRWAREGGVIDEILVENAFRNPEGNPILVDALLLEKVAEEPSIVLLLNTAVFDVSKLDTDTVEGVRAFCSQNSTLYDLRAPLFCDASGDGLVGFMAGAAFRMGAEAQGEFGEKFAPMQSNNQLLGHSLYFYSKDMGRPIQFTPPSFALLDIKQIPRWRQFKSKEQGCKLWWIEHGGLLDTIHDTEEIKRDLWRVVYGVWHHIKNSGMFPDAENLTLEWVGMIPGKRESRRFEGDYILRQQDIVEQRQHADAVAFGGWAIDLHPPEGIFSAQPGCTQWHAKGVYQIPYRCLYSRNIKNLFLAGRIISASHVAFGSSRVMATTAHAGQAVGMAAALCRRGNLLPRQLLDAELMQDLQRELLRNGQHIPQVPLVDPQDLAQRAEVTATSELVLGEFTADGPFVALEDGWAMMIPVRTGTQLAFAMTVQVKVSDTLRVELRQSKKLGNYTPDETLETQSLLLQSGEGQDLHVKFQHRFADDRYAFLCFFGTANILVRTTEQRVTGVLALCHQVNLAVAKTPVQSPPPHIGIDNFEFWQPQRRPNGRNFALRFATPLDSFRAINVLSGFARPTTQPNAWVARWDDSNPRLTFRWKERQRIGRVELMFDVDYDHPLESVLMGHPERRMPFCVERYRILDDSGAVLENCAENHQARRTIRFSFPVRTQSLTIELIQPAALVPAALFQVRCYEE